ncbi:Quinolone resistance protein NorA [Diplonema papillatum]|nr:Quinolone resistance protein NorA [Diplonema papillatum]
MRGTRGLVAALLGRGGQQQRVPKAYWLHTDCGVHPQVPLSFSRPAPYAKGASLATGSGAAESLLPPVHTPAAAAAGDSDGIPRVRDARLTAADGHRSQDARLTPGGSPAPGATESSQVQDARTKAGSESAPPQGTRTNAGSKSAQLPANSGDTSAPGATQSSQAQDARTNALGDTPPNNNNNPTNNKDNTSSSSNTNNDSPTTNNNNEDNTSSSSNNPNGNPATATENDAGGGKPESFSEAWAQCPPRVRRALAILAICGGLESAGIGMVVPFLPGLADELGLGGAGVGLVISAVALGKVATNLQMGRYADTVGRRPLLIWGQALSAAGILFTALSPNFGALLGARLTLGFGAAASAAGTQAMTADLTAGMARHRGLLTGAIGSVSSFSYVLGPALGGALAEVAGLRGPFYAFAAVTLLSCFAYVTLPETLNKQVVNAQQASTAAAASPNVGGVVGEVVDPQASASRLASVDAEPAAAGRPRTVGQASAAASPNVAGVVGIVGEAVDPLLASVDAEPAAASRPRTVGDASAAAQQPRVTDLPPPPLAGGATQSWNPFRGVFAPSSGQAEAEAARAGAPAVGAGLPEESGTSTAWREWKELGRLRSQQGLIACNAACWLGWAIYITLVPLHAAAVWGASPSQLGTMFSAASAAGLAGVPLGGWAGDRYGRMPVLLVGCVLNCAGVGLLSMSATYPQFFLSLLVWEFGEAMLGAVLAALSLDLSPKDKCGQALAMQRQAGDIVFLISPLVIGLCADYFSAGIVLGGCAWVIGGLSTLALVLLRPSRVSTVVASVGRAKKA